MTPESRKDQLLAQAVGKEVVVYDERTHAAHRLNPTAALVWRLADGRRTTSELARILHETMDAPDDEDLVRLALLELDRAGLILGGLPPINEPITRRRMLQFAAALVPVVASISVPTAQGLCTPLQPGYPDCSSSSSSSSSSGITWSSVGQDPSVSVANAPAGAVAWRVNNPDIGHIDGPYSIPGRANPFGFPTILGWRRVATGPPDQNAVTRIFTAPFSVTATRRPPPAVTGGSNGGRDSGPRCEPTVRRDSLSGRMPVTRPSWITFADAS